MVHGTRLGRGEHSARPRVSHTPLLPLLQVRTSFDELVLAELIFSGALDALAANEVAALLSCFVSKGKEPSDEQLAAALVPPLRDARLALVALTTDVAIGGSEASGIPIASPSA